MISKDFQSAISNAAAATIPRGCKTTISPFWNENFELAIQARAKPRIREKEPKIPQT